MTNHIIDYEGIDGRSRGECVSWCPACDPDLPVCAHPNFIFAEPRTCEIYQCDVASPEDMAATIEAYTDCGLIPEWPQ